MASKKKPSRRTNAKASHPKTEQDVREAKIELARVNFLGFIEYVIKDQFGRPVQVAPQQEVWDAHLNYCWKHSKAAAIIAPMNHGKTVSIAIALVLWLLGQNEDFRILLVSSSGPNANKRLQDLQRYVENSEEYREVFPWVQPDKTRPWTQEILNVKRSTDGGGSINASVAAYGYGSSSSVGDRAEAIIFDDVVFDGNAFSKAEREELYRVVTDTWITRHCGMPVYNRWGDFLSGDSLIAMIGTRYHEEDLYATLPMAQQFAWCTLVHRINKEKTAMEATIYGALKDSRHPLLDAYADYAPENPVIRKFQPVTPLPDGDSDELPPITGPTSVSTPLWSLKPRKWLIKEEASIGPTAYARGYEQRPNSSQDLFFPHLHPGNVFWNEDWRKIDDPDNPGYISPLWTRFGGVDLAGKGRRGNVSLTIAVDSYGVRHLVDIRMGAWSQPELCRQLEDVYKTHHPSIINVETNALQEAILDWIAEDPEKYTFGRVCEPFLTTGNKTHPELGLPGLDLQFAARRWRISIPHGRNEIVENNPKDQSKCGCAYCTLVRALEGFTWEDLDKTPDVLMALWFADKAAQSLGDFTAKNLLVDRFNPAELSKATETRNFEEASGRLRLAVETAVYRNGVFGSITKKSQQDMGRGSAQKKASGEVLNQWNLFLVEMLGSGDDRRFYCIDTDETFYESTLPTGAIWRNLTMEERFPEYAGQDGYFFELKAPYGIVPLDNLRQRGAKLMRTGEFPNITCSQQIIMGAHKLMLTDGVLKELS